MTSLYRYAFIEFSTLCSLYPFLFIYFTVKPSPPFNLSHIQTVEGDLILRWKEPLDFSDNLLAYEIRYSHENTNKDTHKNWQVGSRLVKCSFTWMYVLDHPLYFFPGGVCTWTAQCFTGVETLTEVHHPGPLHHPNSACTVERLERPLPDLPEQWGLLVFFSVD